MKIVGRRKPEKRTELLSNDFVARGTLIDDLHGRLVITVNNNSMVCPEVTWRWATESGCRQDHAGWSSKGNIYNGVMQFTYCKILHHYLRR